MGLASDVVIRDMMLADFDSVMELEREIFSSPWTEELFAYELGRAGKTLYLVAEDEGRVLGYLGAQLLGGEIHITNMAVAPALRRRGLGSALLISCVRRGVERGGMWLTLEVRESNHEAREFYRLFGFDEIGLRRGYYSDIGEDAIIMVTGDIRAPEFLANLEKVEASRVRGGSEL